MEEICKSQAEYLFMLVPVYDMLFHSIKDILPLYQLRGVEDVQKFHKSKLAKIGKVQAYNTVNIDQSSMWIEDTLSEVFDRRRNDEGDKDQKISFLFRLLTVMHRKQYPLKGKKLKIEYALKLFMERWIVEALLE